MKEETLSNRNAPKTPSDKQVGQRCLVRAFYIVVAWFIHKFRDPAMTDFWQHSGYRAVVGGYWGKWELGSGFMAVTMWMPSPCEHYPPPPTAESDEPIEREYYANDQRVAPATEAEARNQKDQST